MEKRTKVIASFVFLVVLVVGLYFFSDWFSKTTGYLIEDEEAETALAKCLSGKNAVMYGAKKCSDCKKQKDIFGNGFKFVNYVECNGNMGKCQELRVVPAWEINGKILYGVKSLEELRLLTVCKEF